LSETRFLRENGFLNALERRRKVKKMFYKQERLQKSEHKYGEYFGTYVSENELVKVHLFVRNGHVVPYAIFKPPHHAFENVDNWMTDVDRIVEEHGYPHIKFVYWWV